MTIERCSDSEKEDISCPIEHSSFQFLEVFFCILIQFRIRQNESMIFLR
jgi:hypothetical protein